jgi:RNA polymerase sigma factor (sigma-70 family)
MTRAGMAVHLPLVRARTDTTFEELYRAYVGDIYRYALAITGNTADAEDVTQTTFMNAYRAYAGGEQPLKPKNWLLTIAHNVCRQRARLASHRPSEVEYDETIGASDVPPDTVPSAGDIRRALAHLPYAQRATLIMRELEGRSHAEIAAVLGVTTHATEMLAFRARRALREHLAGSLTCTQAADALDRKGDGTLGPDEEALLRAHLRECDECERAARMLRAQRTAWRALAVVPLPSSLHAFGGGGTAAAVAGTGVAAKVIVVSLAAVTVAGGAYVSKHAIGAAHHPRAITRTQHRPAATQRRRPVATATAPHPRLVAAPARPTHAPANSAKARPVAPAPHAPPSHPAHVHPAHPTAPHANNGVRRRPHGIQHGRPVKDP